LTKEEAKQEVETKTKEVDPKEDIKTEEVKDMTPETPEEGKE
jgi:hypothetical protein